MPLINCEIRLDLTWSKKCVFSSAVGVTEFKITDTELYVPVVTLSTEDNVKLNDYNGTQTYNHLVRKRTLNHLTKLAKWLNG